MAVRIVNKFHSFKLGDLIELNKGQRIEPKTKGNYPIFGAGEKKQATLTRGTMLAESLSQEKEQLAKSIKENLSTL